MMKDVPYFCHSHLLSLIEVAPTTTTPNPPAFNELLVPSSPLGGQDDVILSTADIAKARQMIAAVSCCVLGARALLLCRQIVIRTYRFSWGSGGALAQRCRAAASTTPMRHVGSQRAVQILPAPVTVAVTGTGTVMLLQGKMPAAALSDVVVLHHAGHSPPQL